MKFTAFFSHQIPRPTVNGHYWKHGETNPWALEDFRFPAEFLQIKLQSAAKVTPERTKVVPANAKAMQQWRMRLKDGNQENHVQTFCQIMVI